MNTDCTLALDPNDDPHICYTALNGDLKYASWDGAAWSTQTVDSGYMGVGSSLAFDPAGNPHISYLNYTTISPVEITDITLKYASWEGTSWSAQKVASANGDSSLVFDNNGTAHISVQGY